MWHRTCNVLALTPVDGKTLLRPSGLEDLGFTMPCAHILEAELGSGASAVARDPSSAARGSSEPAAAFQCPSQRSTSTRLLPKRVRVFVHYDGAETSNGLPLLPGDACAFMRMVMRPSVDLKCNDLQVTSRTQSDPRNHEWEGSVLPVGGGDLHVIIGTSLSPAPCCPAYPLARACSPSSPASRWRRRRAYGRCC